MNTLKIYVPRDGTWLKDTLIRGSAIVSLGPQHDGRMVVYYEGDRYGQGRAFMERAICAADALRHRFPTIAKAIAHEDELIEVGEMTRVTDSIYAEYKGWKFALDGPKLAPWLREVVH